MPAPRLVAFAVLCALAAAVALWLRPGVSTPPVPSPLAPSVPAAATAMTTAMGAERRAAAAPTPAPSQEATLTLRGRCLAAENDTPLAATLYVGIDDGTPDGDAGTLPTQALVSATAGSDGTFTLTVPLATTADLRLHAQAQDRAAGGTRLAAAVPGSEWNVGDVRLRRCGRVRGEVVDTSGAPVADAEVGLIMLGHERPALVFREAHTALTDARGAFTFPAPVATGEWYVRVERTGALRTPRKTEVPAGGDHVVRIEVERPDPALAIRGKVVDRAGAALPAIELAAYGAGARGRAVSGADGTFVLHRGPPHFDRGQGGIELSAQADGLEQASPTMGQVAAWGQHDVVVVMRPLQTVVVRAVDSRGAVVWPFRIALGKVTASGTGWIAVPASRAQVEVDHLVLTRLGSGLHTLLLLPQDPALAIAGPQPLVVDDATPRELVVRVPDRVFVHVDVVDPVGAPVGRCKLELVASLVATAPDAAQPAPDLASARLANDRPPRQLALATATTDANGRATFAAPPGTWLLRATCSTHRPGSTTIVVAAGSTHHRLVLAPAAVVRGRLVPAAALPALGIAETRPERRLAVVARAGGTDVARAEVAADGTFELGPLPPGVATLRLAAWLTASDAHRASMQHVLGDVDGAGSAAIEREYDVATFVPATVTGVVVFDGAPLRSGQFFLRRLRPEPVGTVRVSTDGEGRFRTLMPPGELGPQLAIPSDPGPGHVILPMAERWTVAAGQTLELRLEARTRRLQLRLLQADGAPLAATRLQIEGDGYNRPGLVQTDAAGRVDLPLAPYGTFLVRARSADGKQLEAAVTVDPAEENAIVAVRLRVAGR